MIKRGIGFIMAAILLAAPLGASAAASPWSDEPTYRSKVAAKLKYGLTNTLLGWTSLFRTPMHSREAGENVLVGIGHGVWNAIGQTVLGAVHLVTFPITPLDVNLPDGGTDILNRK